MKIVFPYFIFLKISFLQRASFSLLSSFSMPSSFLFSEPFSEPFWVFSLQKILGHASIEMTRHYAELAQSDVDKKMKTYSPAESINIKV